MKWKELKMMTVKEVSEKNDLRGMEREEVIDTSKKMKRGKHSWKNGIVVEILKYGNNRIIAEIIW